MNVSLTADIADFVEGELATGDYASASEVVRDALRMLRRDRAIEQEKLVILRREITSALDQVDGGRLSDRTIMDIAAAVEREEAGEA
ncbi:MAG TPA: type II toxin-antitoxin system ParD family antitoxin [Beijerinckiaceae bacterium]|nr:type II toxin-antitoxin system ParD family antitoxin [Beijerinckiaceae bacterium]